MSIFGLAFYFTFGGNILVQWGVIPGTRAKHAGSWGASFAFIIAAAVAAVFDGLLFRYSLTPMGLESIAPITFALFVFGAYAALRALFAAINKPFIDPFDDNSFQMTLVLYAAAMTAGQCFSSVWLLLGGGAMAAFGYLAATRFLDAIMERLDLEPVPATFRGAPIRFISAGLMALAFSGVDASFFSRISG
ncbi:MAG TPA: hypothetical protein VMX33_02380 [bacterium]|nr:hypothetical protein [bacterium]